MGGEDQEVRGRPKVEVRVSQNANFHLNTKDGFQMLRYQPFLQLD